MSNDRTKLSTILPKQLPEFVREDYPIFVQFLEYYYEYLDQQDVGSITSLRDLDTTSDAFIQYLKNELNFIGSFEDINPGLNTRTVLKHIKGGYKNKGSEDSIISLMRMMFNKEAEVLYPNEYILKASDGKWQQDVSVFATITSGDPLTLVGNEIRFTGTNKKQVATVQRVKQVSGVIYEIFLDKNFIGDIIPGDILTFDTVSAVVLPTTSTSSIIRGGQSFRLGQIYEVKTNTGTGTRIKITGVDANGGITRYSMINFGTGYADSFYATLTPQIISSATSGLSDSKITINKTPGTGSATSLSVPANSDIEGFSDYGSIVAPNYWSPSFSDGTYVGTKLIGFYNQQFKSLSNEYAVINFTLGGMARYPGSYIKNDGFLSDAMKIQDSKYYQAYSYVIRIDELLSTFKEIVKTYVHPAGMSLFSDYEVKNYITLTASVQAVINFLRRRFDDNFSVTDTAATFDIAKYLTEQEFITEQYAYVLTRGISETPLVSTDNYSQLFTKSASDGIAATDAISKVDLNKSLAETLIISDSSPLAVTLGNFSETLVITDAFGINQLSVMNFTDTQPVVDSGGYYVVNPYNSDITYFASNYVNPRITF